MLNLAPSRMAVVQIYAFYGVKFSLSIDATKLLIPEVCDTILDDARCAQNLGMHDSNRTRHAAKLSAHSSRSPTLLNHTTEPE